MICRFPDCDCEVVHEANCPYDDGADEDFDDFEYPFPDDDPVEQTKGG